MTETLQPDTGRVLLALPAVLWLGHHARARAVPAT
jgi:hypothetical protein